MSSLLMLAPRILAVRILVTVVAVFVPRKSLYFRRRVNHKRWYIGNENPHRSSAATLLGVVPLNSRHCSRGAEHWRVLACMKGAR